MAAQNYPGHCLCKLVQFIASGTVRDLCCCHCVSCRQAAGAPFVAWGTVDLANFQVVGGCIQFVNSSAHVERGFCSNCGSSLTYRHADRSHEIDFTLACLDDPAALVPCYHIWVQEKLPWVAIDDGLPQHQRVAGK